MPLSRLLCVSPDSIRFSAVMVFLIKFFISSDMLNSALPKAKHHAVSPFYHSIPFWREQKISNVLVLYSISAHVDLVQRDHVFRKVVRYRFQRTEFALNRAF